jgi:hypothetical protein
MGLSVRLTEIFYSKISDRTYFMEYFYSNITHNLVDMAKEAGIYLHLWRPKELGITLAKDLIEPLEKGLAEMRSKPEHFRKFDSPNGWGTYKHFVPFVDKYLEACKEFPESTIEVDR